MKMFTWWVLICLLGVSAFAEGNGEKLQIEGVWQTSVKSGYLPVVGAMKHGARREKASSGFAVPEAGI